MAEQTSAIPLEIKQSNILQNTTEQKQAPETKKKPWFFVNIWNKLKSWWVVEEEEYIDGHGFRHKRSKTKIPLRDKNLAEKQELRYKSGESLAYVTQHTPFGRMFL